MKKQESRLQSRGIVQTASFLLNERSPSIVMIASSLCNYTILSAAAKMSTTAVVLMNVVITVIGVVLALFVNLRYGKLLARTEK